MKKINIILLIIAIVFASSCSSQTIHIKGKWQSEQIENTGNGAFGKRVFTIDDKQWQVQFTLYLDSAATMPVFTFRAVGDYTLGKKSGNVKYATEAVFGFNHKYLTVQTADTNLIKNLGFAGCGLTYNNEKDITETGCSFFESKAACAQEYDLASIKNNKLFLGERPAPGKNICSEENRPTALGLPLIKVQ